LNSIRPTVDDRTVRGLANILKKSKGSVKISFNKNPCLSVSLGSNDIRLDVEDPSIFEKIELNSGSDSNGFFDKLKKAQKLAEILNDCGLSLVILRKGKEAFTIGRNATPTLSSVLTGSDDIHIDSITQAAKLGKDLSKSNKKNRKKTH
jgi:hypothetical protein